MKHGIGILGLGAISDFHARAARALERGALVACCSRDPHKAKLFAERHACTPYSSVQEFLAHPGLDVVSIATAAGHHMEPALEAIGSGKHVMIEKPIEISLERCDRIIEAARTAGVLVSGVFQSRFQEVAQIVKGAIDEGRFGRITLGDAYVKWFRSQEYYDATIGRGTWGYDGGGALMNQGIHAVDLLQWFMGPVESVSARVSTIGHTGIEVEDNAVATLRFRNGAFGVIEGSTSIYPGFPKRIEISGTAGSATLEESVLTTWSFAQPSPSSPSDEEIVRAYGKRPAGSGGAADPLAIGFEGHRKQLDDLLRAIDEGGQPRIDGEEARKSVEIVLAIYRSARDRREVFL